MTARRFIWRLAGLSFFCATVLAPFSTAAYPDPQQAPHYFDSNCTVDNGRNFIYDYLGLMNVSQGQAVEMTACSLYQATSAHVALVLVPDTGEESLDGYATHLLERWGLGDPQRHDGILILYAADAGSGQAGVRVEVGYGLEGVVNAVIARNVTETIQGLKSERLAMGDSETGATSHALGEGTLGLIRFLQRNYEGIPAGHTSGSPAFPVGLLLLILLGGGALLFFLLKGVAAFLLYRRKPINEWGDMPEPTRSGWFLRGFDDAGPSFSSSHPGSWNSPQQIPSTPAGPYPVPTDPGARKAHRRGRAVAWAIFSLQIVGQILLLVLTLGRSGFGWSKGKNRGGNFGGGRSGGGGWSGRL